MANVCQEAGNVWIWLGEADSTSDAAIEHIACLASRDKDVLKYAPASWVWNSESLAFDRLLGRPRFRRRWVIQEAAFSQRSIMFCGARQLDMSEFVRAVHFVQYSLEHMSSSLMPLNREIYGLNPLPGFRDSPATRLLDLLSAVFSNLAWEGQTVLVRRLKLEELVDLAVFCETSDVRDTMFALLGLARDVSGPKKHNEHETHLEANYGESSMNVFKQFVWHCPIRSRSLDIICRPWAPVSVTAVTPGRQTYPQFNVILPSWIASRDRLVYGNPSSRTTQCLLGEPLVGRAQKRVYSAHGQTTPQISMVHSVGYGLFNGILCTRGVMFGQIYVVSPRMAQAVITRDCSVALGGRLDTEHGIHVPQKA